MEPWPAAASPSRTTVAATSTIEDAVRKLASAPEGDVTVVSSSGQPIGIVTFRQLAIAMVNSHDDAERDSSSLVAAL